MKQTSYDVAVIGGGPGGYAAALYCARSGFSVIVLEQLSPGGQMATTGQVDNYPGFEEGIDGFELGEKMQKGAERFGAETAFVSVKWEAATVRRRTPSIWLKSAKRYIWFTGATACGPLKSIWTH